MDSGSDKIKTAIEIGMMAGQLSVKNQSYVLNTIQALLFSQQTSDAGQLESVGREDNSSGGSFGKRK